MFLPAPKSFSALQRAENSSIETLSNCTSPRSRRFSALQRAENSSIVRTDNRHNICHRRFQCSSASRKFLNRTLPAAHHTPTCVSVLFSEPKIPQSCNVIHFAPVLRAFQCSSASRKFLNFAGWILSETRCTCFSALQRAENSSMSARNRRTLSISSVSVLFSEPKIPQ